MADLSRRLSSSSIRPDLLDVNSQPTDPKLQSNIEQGAESLAKSFEAQVHQVQDKLKEIAEIVDTQSELFGQVLEAFCSSFEQCTEVAEKGLEDADNLLRELSFIKEFNEQMNEMKSTVTQLEKLL